MLPFQELRFFKRLGFRKIHTNDSVYRKLVTDFTFHVMTANDTAIAHFKLALY